ncbi:hypothetical protein CBR_g45705 [Chara braunii]|uniref:coproporphyrinogen oxidase n=1 Tax=Chara braunii TaxID=69332 RepID=A0A388K3L7_CHABU|nr:hypothetical protein CBR_g45705 [Chara braunii]|eukprot:GBG64650.1 hypothetical protein CBR_g45705 [Chara braunii]
MACTVGAAAAASLAPSTCCSLASSSTKSSSSSSELRFSAVDMAAPSSFFRFTPAAAGSKCSSFPLSSSSFLKLKKSDKKKKMGGGSAFGPRAATAAPKERAIEEETMVEETPATLLRESELERGANGDGKSMRARFERMVRDVQDSVCAAVEEVDGAAKFREDAWTRPGGGGGISRVLANGAVWEKAGVNVSVVYGKMPPEAYRAATGGSPGPSAKPIPFFAAGVSSVMHPWNPFAPTMHFNYRYFETEAVEGADSAPKAWWFGGGTDLTPSYLFDEDVKHFHQVQKDACDKHDPEFYPRFKKWCDEYFLIKVYDRGTTFGLKTGGRIESILMSLPLTARWEYDHSPPKGSEEARLLDACINPREWV